MNIVNLQEARCEPETVGSVLSREEAFEDGILVDASDVASGFGFSMPVALTQDCWRDCVSWEDADNERKGVSDTEGGRLRDVLFNGMNALANAGRRRYSKPSICYSVYRIPRRGLFRAPREVELRLAVEVEDGKLVATISLASE